MFRLVLKGFTVVGFDLTYLFLLKVFDSLLPRNLIPVHLVDTKAHGRQDSGHALEQWFCKATHEGNLRLRHLDSVT